MRRVVLYSLLFTFLLFFPSYASNGGDLIKAAQNGDISKVKELLDKGADVNVKDQSGRTALMAAGYFGYEDVVKMLLDNGAHVNTKDNAGITSLIWVCDSKREHINVVKALIAKGADVNASNKKGETALMKASFSGYSDIVKTLIANEADVNKIAYNGATALLAAKQKGNQEIVQILKNAGAKDMDLVEGLIQNLQNTERDVRLKAVEGLAFNKDVRAIKPLIDILRVKSDEYICERATFALGNSIGTVYRSLGKEAIEPIIIALKDKDSFIRERMAWALAFSRIKDTIVENALMDALGKKDLSVIAWAYLFFIRKGKTGTEDLLIQALDKYGYDMMASDYQNCGNAKLQEAAKRWSEKHSRPLPKPMLGISMGPSWEEDQKK
jgi:hypothetical protein